MEKEIIVAIISASAVVVAALITGIFSIVKKSKDHRSSSTKINQRQGLGNKGTQIGIQNNYSSFDNKKRRSKR